MGIKLRHDEPREGTAGRELTQRFIHNLIQNREDSRKSRGGLPLIFERRVTS